MYRPRATIHESAQVETIERRGRELFVQDQLAWHGTDLLAARQSTRELSKTGGFVAVPGTDNGGTLYFFGRDRAADEVRWVVEFSAGGPGHPAPGKPRYSIP